MDILATNKLRVLVACEYSGVVRDAFTARGHTSWSADLLPSETPGNHYQGDVRDILREGWDLMIAHPPCTYLSYAANAVWNRPGRAERRHEAMHFFMQLYYAPIPLVCVENPMGYPFRAFRKPDQTIDPTLFGVHEHKRTCLWLRGLAPLMYTGPIVGYVAPRYVDKSGKRRYMVGALPPRKDRGHLLSRTFDEIGAAMAAQWG
jgi:hypothetical protein